MPTRVCSGGYLLNGCIKRSFLKEVAYCHQKCDCQSEFEFEFPYGLQKERSFRIVADQYYYSIKFKYPLRLSLFIDREILSSTVGLCEFNTKFKNARIHSIGVGQ